MPRAEGLAGSVEASGMVAGRKMSARVRGCRITLATPLVALFAAGASAQSVPRLLVVRGDETDALTHVRAFDQDRIGENETPTEGHTLLNADLAYTFKLDAAAGGVPEMTIGLRGVNLLDAEVRNHVSFRKDEVVQPGRTIRLYGIVKLN